MTPDQTLANKSIAEPTPIFGCAAFLSQDSISVVIPAHNHAGELSKCLAAFENFPSEALELIVVDDQSTENISEVADQYRAQYFRTPGRGGPAPARNIGARQARGNIFLFLDADVVVSPDAIQIIRKCFADDPGLMALFGSYDDEPTCPNFWSSFKNLLHHYVHQSSSSEAVTFWAGCGAIRRSAFEAIGGFNAERFPIPSIEDIELGLRLSAQGHKIALIKHLQVKHLKTWTPLMVWRTDIFQRALPWSRLILETGTLRSDLNLTWASRMSAALVAILAMLLACLSLSLIGFPPRESALFGSLASIDSFLLLSLNRKLYRFFERKRGSAFAVGAVWAHWFYLFYSGMTFFCCFAAQLPRNWFRSPRPDIESEHAQIFSLAARR